MKKVMFIVVILVGFNISAQEGFRVGANAGLPIGSNGDFASIVVNLELDYDWEVSEKVSVGASAGALVFSGKSDYNDFKYAPIVGSVDLEILEGLSVGANLGYGVSLESDFNGGFVYRAQGRYNICGTFDVTLSYNGFHSDIDGGLSHLGLGAGYRF